MNRVEVRQMRNKIKNQVEAFPDKAGIFPNKPYKRIEDLSRICGRELYLIALGNSTGVISEYIIAKGPGRAWKLYCEIIKKFVEDAKEDDQKRFIIDRALDMKGRIEKARHMTLPDYDIKPMPAKLESTQAV